MATKSKKTTVKTTPKKAVKKGADFQQQFAKLEKITADFEAGEYGLEEGLKKFEEGLQIAQELKRHLEGVENKIETIKGKYNELTQED